jgi:hypothetical protein
VVDPSDVSYLTSHLKKLPIDAQKYLVWASCFGAMRVLKSSRFSTLSPHFLNVLLYRFKTTDVAAVMDHDSPSGSSSSDFDTEDDWSLNGLVHTSREKSTTATRRSMRGLQAAISEGWLVQRARDLCSFAHDRYRQAAEAEALSLPDDFIAKMSFRVRVFQSRPLTMTELCFRSSQ